MVVEGEGPNNTRRRLSELGRNRTSTLKTYREKEEKRVCGVQVGGMHNLVVSGYKGHVRELKKAGATKASQKCKTQYIRNVTNITKPLNARSVSSTHEYPPLKRSYMLRRNATIPCPAAWQNVETGPAAILN